MFMFLSWLHGDDDEYWMGRRLMIVSCLCIWNEERVGVRGHGIIRRVKISVYNYTYTLGVLPLIPFSVSFNYHLRSHSSQVPGMMMRGKNITQNGLLLAYSLHSSQQVKIRAWGR
jgi:hypothetical protein